MQKIRLLFLFTVVYSITFGQQQQLPCGQHIYLKEQLKDPNFKLKYDLEQKVQQEVLKEMLKNPNQKRGIIYKIPVVFHVLHSNGVENISRAQIIDQLAILNRDFRLKNADAANVHPDFKGLPADAEIEFVLATKAPDGTCFSGVTRTYKSTTLTTSYDQIDAIVNENDVCQTGWDGDKYLNIFVCAGFDIQASGYTNLPWSNTNMSNGIFMLHNYIGSIGTSYLRNSRVLTHEIGHWLNLYHTWGPTNDAGLLTNCSTDDEVEDTPNCIGDKGTCNLDDLSCSTRANIENYMDYSFCNKMFTQGQVDRMHAALNSPIGGRNNLWTIQNLTEVGATSLPLCKAEFTISNSQICEGGQVTFSDVSYNSPVSWLWSFPGGSPSSSNLQNPSVTYNHKGNYNVTLTVSDGTNSKTITKTNLINVINDQKSLPFIETFSSYSSLSNASFWSSSNTGNNESFQIYSGAGFSDNTCLKLANFQENTISSDELTSNTLDLSKITNQGLITLTFRYAYRKKNSANSEVLRVSMSGDCGMTWNSRKVLSGANLSSLISTSDWTPTSISDWTTVHVTNINSSYWSPNTRLRFTFDGSGGNNFFLDDINVYPSSPSSSLYLSVDELNKSEEIRVFPNPTDNELSLEFQLNNQQIVDYAIINILGKTISKHAIQAGAGNNLVVIPTKDLQEGSYFIKLNFGGEAVIKYFQVGRE